MKEGYKHNRKSNVKLFTLNERRETLRWMMENGLWNKSVVGSLQSTRNKRKTENVRGEKFYTMLNDKSDAADKYAMLNEECENERWATKEENRKMSEARWNIPARI